MQTVIKNKITILFQRVSFEGRFRKKLITVATEKESVKFQEKLEAGANIAGCKNVSKSEC